MGRFLVRETRAGACPQDYLLVNPVLALCILGLKPESQAYFEFLETCDRLQPPKGKILGTGKKTAASQVPSPFIFSFVQHDLGYLVFGMTYGILLKTSSLTLIAAMDEYLLPYFAVTRHEYRTRLKHPYATVSQVALLG